MTVFAPDNLEFNDTRGNRALLQELSALTGGQVLAPTAVGELLQLSALCLGRFKTRCARLYGTAGATSGSSSAVWRPSGSCAGGSD